MTGPKLVTAKQLAANRRNAQKSTGPRTLEGKAASRWNALKHGLLSRAVIPPSLEPYESRADFESLLAALREEFAPASALEQLLIERIATGYWRLARLLRAEAGAVAARKTEYRRRLAEDDEERRSYTTELAAFLDILQSEDAPSAPSQPSLAALRAWLIENNDETWEDCPPDQLFDAARADLEESRQEPPDRQQNLVILEDCGSLPEPDHLRFLARYEAALDRQIYRALNALERYQHLRAGQPVPPPLDVNLIIDAPPES
jgi:hypothetical protein